MGTKNHSHRWPSNLNQRPNFVGNHSIKFHALLVYPPSNMAGRLKISLEGFAGRIIKLNAWLPSKPCLITGGYMHRGYPRWQLPFWPPDYSKSRCQPTMHPIIQLKNPVVCLYGYIYIYMYIHKLQMCKYICDQMCMHTYKCKHVCVYIYIYMYAYTHSVYM